MPLLAASACTPPPAPRVACGQFELQAVTQSAAGEIFVAGQTDAYGVKTPTPLTTGGPFIAAVGATGGVDWLHVLPYDDGSSLALDPRADAGPVVIGGGAAAAHYDAAGDVALTVGYPGNLGAQVAVTSDDRIVVADNESVRAFGGGGGELWALALPVNINLLTLAVADRSGGVWLGGNFVGSELPPRPPTMDAGGTGGAFLMHLDRDGAPIGLGIFRPSSATESITFVRGVVSADPAATASLIVTGMYQGTVADLMLSPSPYGTVAVVAAFDSSGTVVWVNPRSSAPLPLSGLPLVVPEASGTFVVLTSQLSAAPDPRAIGIVAARWDAGGQELASSTMAVASLSTSWIAAPAAGGAGALVVGEAGGTCQSPRHFLFQVGADLQFQPLPFMLDQGRSQPGASP